MKNISKYLIILLMELIACTPRQSEIKLQTGDLLFVSEKKGQLSNAIDKATQTIQATHFSHVGIVKVSNDSVFVLHASSKKGICKVSLNNFLYSEGDSIEIVAYRLKKQWQKTIPEAIKKAEQMLGRPYNFSYILSDSAHYCSEFIYRAFISDSVFSIKPMTFKDKETGKFIPAWVKHYQKLGIEIPEGLPGCNPNGMATSKKLEQLGIIKAPYQE